MAIVAAAVIASVAATTAFAIAAVAARVSSPTGTGAADKDRGLKL